MSSPTYRCQRCRETIQGNSRHCVSCFRALHRPCPECMVQGAGGRYRVRRKKGGPGASRRQSQSVDCDRCNNERWVLG